MKKIVIAILVIALIVCCFACNKNEGDVKIIKVYVPDGAPSLAIAKLVSEGYLSNDDSNNKYKIEYNIVAGVTNIRANVLKGEADIAVLPSNIAANLYNNNVDIKVICGNIFGVLYMVGLPIDSLDELKGKVVYNIGQGGTPDLLFKYILRENGIDYVEQDTAENGKVALCYVNDGPSMIQHFLAKKAEYGVLGEPAATQAVNKTSTTDKPLKVVLDLQKEWNSITDFDGYPQAVTVVKGSLLKDDKAFVDNFLKEMESSVLWLDGNINDANESLKKLGGNTTFNAAVLPKCNVKCVTAADLKDNLNAYLGILHSFNAASVGGKLPDENFYAVL